MIYTEYPNAWNETIADISENQVIITTGDDYVKVAEKDPGKDIEVEIIKTYVTAQIGPGWVI